MNLFKSMKTASAAAMVACSALTATPALADYPADKAVTMIIPFGAGGGADSIGRVFAAALQQELSQNIVAQNFTGTAGTVGAGAVASADADGYTIGWIPIGPLATQPHLRNLPYDKDSFKTVCNVTQANVVLMTTEATGYNNVDDVVGAAKENPNGLVYIGSPGSIPHVAMLAFNNAFGTQMKGIQGNTGDALKHINGGVAHLNAALPINGMKSLAVFATEGDPNHPGVPTVKSAGADLQFSIWMGVVVPKDTPDEIVAALDTACSAATQSAAFVENMGKLGWPIAYKNSSDFRAFYDNEFETLGGLLKDAGLKK